jgi:tRNA pseudouridine13 synthase
MRSPEGEPAELERRIAAETLGNGREGTRTIDLARTRALGEGSRRALRVWVDGLRCERIEPTEDERRKGTASMRVYFVLPKGAYATTVLGAAFTIDESHGEPGEREENGLEGDLPTEDGAG